MTSSQGSPLAWTTSGQPKVSAGMADSTQHLIHDIRLPLQLLEAIVEQMKHQCDLMPVFPFEHDYFIELSIYFALIKRTIVEAEVLRNGPENIRLSRQRSVDVGADILQPAICWCQHTLRAARIPASQVTVEKSQSSRRIYVDNKLLSLAVSILIENSIVRFDRSDTLQNEFTCSIRVHNSIATVMIELFDNGRGIDVVQYDQLSADPTAKLEQPGRYRYSPFRNFLWVARQIIERHGGRLSWERGGDSNVTRIEVPVGVVPKGET